MATYINPQSAFCDQYCPQGFIGFGPGGNSDLHFVNGLSQETINTITEAAANWDWTPATCPTGPRLNSFEAAILADTNLSAVAKLQLDLWIILLERNMPNAELIQEGWQALVEINSSSWLTTEVQVIVENYAEQYNIPLTSN